MLLLKIFFTTYQPSPDKGGLTCYELISYHFVIIIGLQKYGFSLNWQTIFVYFSVAYSRLFHLGFRCSFKNVVIL